MIKSKIRGAVEAEKALKAELEKMLKDAKAVTHKNGLKVKRRTIENAPVDSGDLSQSIRKTNADDMRKAVVYSEEEYAPYPEEGTERQAPQHYMKRALNETEPEYIQELKDVLKR